MQVITLEAGELPKPEDIARESVSDPVVEASVKEILAAVKEKGDAALLELTEKFDGQKLKTTEVGEMALQAASRQVSRPLQAALQRAGEHIKDFAELQVEHSTWQTRPDGALVATKVSPLESVGIYAPGGKALYPSTVLMCAIPAAVAGVRRIVLCTPPGPKGAPDPSLLYAAQLAGVTEIHSVGGAQAIAAMAYGTDGIAKVDKIVGPGNAYVACAKRLLQGVVGSDMIAGPSEVCILADETAEPSLVAIDLLAQAEHDQNAVCYLVTTDPELADDVQAELAEYLQDSPRAEISKASLDEHGKIFIAPDLYTAIQVSNQIAPEHLEVQMDSPMELLGLIENAGAIFLGGWTPVATGDYLAGPSHTLPTGGSAAYSNPLSVQDFIKKSSVVSYSPAALRADGGAIQTIAEHEGLWAHAKSVKARFELFEDSADEED
ncbi:MAG: histidinol dehydrogenase [Coriobacteriales bacterium]|jgi:histidinol dehydrogenase|nr:histidinol dehydrogenase [Coriobacteriales bacterium]